LFRYIKGQKFGRHVDESIVFANSETKYTLLIYLSGSDSKSSNQEALSGGETIFYGEFCDLCFIKTCEL